MERFLRRTAAIVAATACGAVLAVSSAQGQNSVPAAPAPVTQPPAPAVPAASPTPSGPAAPSASPAPSGPAAPTAAPATAPSGSVAFGQQEIDQSRLIAVASPFAGGRSHQLLILEQISDERPCWAALGGTPNAIDPLLLSFNFTGICGRSTDSNSYSVRVNGVDMARQYRLRIINRNQDLVLVADPIDCFQPDRDRCTDPPLVEVGRTYGLTNGYAEIKLDRGWRFTRRTLNGRPLGHIYLTYEGVFPPAPIAATPPTASPAPAVPPSTLAFLDIGGDVYASEIQQAVQLGFIAGFENGTFRPQQTLTREQLVSMVLEALRRLPGVNLTLPTTTTASPYRDVDASRWSAAKIEFARANNIVSGYEDGTFRPTQPVTRAEMMAVLRRAAEYGRSLRGLSATLQPLGQPKFFSDTADHWAAALISQMSAYCNVASPVNETGTGFAPNEETRRNYAAAATLRTFNCVQSAQN